MPTTIVLTGFKEFETKLKNLPKELMDEIDGEVKYAAEFWVKLAKRDAPKNFGTLAGLIDAYQLFVATKKDERAWEVTSGAEYSPYMEWGTGSRAKIPTELVAYAAQWWTRKKHVGIYPHPYFFIQKPLVEKELVARVNNILKTEH